MIGYMIAFSCCPPVDEDGNSRDKVGDIFTSHPAVDVIAGERLFGDADDVNRREHILKECDRGRGFVLSFLILPDGRIAVRTVPYCSYSAARTQGALDVFERWNGQDASYFDMIFSEHLPTKE